METFTVGVLGGGQLGLMLKEAADELSQKLDIQINCIFLCKEGDPCSQFEHIVGDVTNYDDVLNFGKYIATLDNSILTIEIESVNVDALLVLNNDYGLKCFPRRDSIYLIQNKYTQFERLKGADLPLPKYVLAPNGELIIQWIDELTDFNFPMIAKLLNGSYDGNGTFEITSVGDLPQVKSDYIILQEKVKIAQKISVIVGVSRNMDVFNYPVFDKCLNDDQVQFVRYPSKIDVELQAQAIEIAKQCAEAFEIIGLLAVEMFVTKDGRILVNEVAPRPHNSGHLTINGFDISQFELHLRCILGLTDGITNPKPTEPL